VCYLAATVSTSRFADSAKRSVNRTGAFVLFVFVAATVSTLRFADSVKRSVNRTGAFRFALFLFSFRNTVFISKYLFCCLFLCGNCVYVTSPSFFFIISFFNFCLIFQVLHKDARDALLRRPQREVRAYPHLTPFTYTAHLIPHP
jgi:hypothetical protein